MHAARSHSASSHGASSHGASSHHHGTRGAPPGAPPDAEALLVALTLSPATYSRNRFFEMYKSPDVARTRRRAGQLRSLVTALVSHASAEGAGRLLSIEATDDGGAVLVYDVASLGMRRTMRLRSIEMSLLRYCVSRARGESTPAELLPASADSEKIGVALQRLSPLPDDRAAE
jgi:hypothetical protein